MLKSLIVASCLFSTPVFASSCLHYGDTVTLAGRFGTATVPNGVAERADVFLLDEPICVAEDVVSAGIAGAMSVQLSCPTLEANLGSALSLTGRLVGAHTGNGQTPVLLVCGS